MKYEILGNEVLVAKLVEDHSSDGMVCVSEAMFTLFKNVPEQKNRFNWLNHMLINCEGINKIEM